MLTGVAWCQPNEAEIDDGDAEQRQYRDQQASGGYSYPLAAPGAHEAGSERLAVPEPARQVISRTTVSEAHRGARVGSGRRWYPPRSLLAPQIVSSWAKTIHGSSSFRISAARW